MAGRSNGVFLPLMPSPPLPGAGYTVDVYAHTDLLAYARGRRPAPIARITRFEALSWSPEISDTGAGSITLALSDPLFVYALADGRSPSAIYRYDNLFVVHEDGQWRGEFFGMRVDMPRTPAAEAGGRTVTISGPGAAHCLAWAKVMSPYYPKTTPKGKIGVYQYKNVPVMSAWLQLLWAAQNRGTIPFVHCRFSATKDTGGAKWEDTPPPKPKNTAVTTLGSVAFNYDSSELTDAGKASVAKIAGKLADVTAPRVDVVGHASSEGSKAYNLQKGLDRANTVANAILAIQPRAGVHTSSKGETQPIATNRTAAGRRKNRRAVVTYQSAPDYVDTIYTPERGTSLLQLLKQLTSGQSIAENRGPIHCEWIMQKQFELHVRSQIGKDRSAAVVFHEGSTYVVSEDLAYDRSEIANVAAVQNDQHVYKIATSPASIAHWGQRELYTRIEGSYADKLHAQIAATQKAAYANQQASTVIKIVAGPYRMPFRDFGLGDWIGLSRAHGKLPSTVEKQRVIAISVAVGADGRADYELTLSTATQARVKWLQTQIDALTNRRPGIRPFIQDDEPTGGLPGDLWTPATAAST